MYRGVIFLQVQVSLKTSTNDIISVKKILCVKPLHHLRNRCYSQKSVLCTLETRIDELGARWELTSGLGHQHQHYYWDLWCEKYNCKTIFRAAIHTFLKLVESIFSAKKIDGKVCKSHPQNFVTQMSKS